MVARSMGVRRRRPAASWTSEGECGARYGRERKQETRRRIIETAGRRFKSDGIDGSGIAALMAQCRSLLWGLDTIRPAPGGCQNIVLSLAAVSGTACSEFQCSTILASRTRKRSMTDRPRSPGVST